MKWAIILGFILTTFLFFTPPTDPDLFWHLKYGQIIFEEHRFPAKDEFSWTFSGFESANSYWFSDVASYIGFRYLGLFPLTLIFSALGALSYLLVTFFAAKEERSLLYLFSLIFAASTAMDFVRIRAQAFSIFFLALLLIFLFKGYWREKKFLLLLPPFFALWANTHFGFTVGLFYLFSFVFFEFIAAIAKKGSKRFLPLAFLLIFAVISSLSTLANPFGLLLWETIFGDAISPMWSNIVNWQYTPTSFRHNILLLSTMIFAIFSWRAYFTRIPLSFLASSFLALFMGIRSLFFLPFWGLFFGWLIRAYPPFFFQVKKIRLYLVPFGVITFLLFGIALYLNTYLAVWAIFHPREMEKKHGYPKASLEYLQTQDAANVLNEYAWGGYMIWYSPQVKTFIDGRMTGWKRNKQSIFGDYLEIMKGEEKSRDLLAEYQVEWVLIRKNTKLEEKILSQSGWEKVFEDESSVVFRKV